MENLKNYLFELCSESAPSGREELLTSLERLAAGFADEVKRDSAGNLICVKRCGIPGAPVLMLDAHADEIGLVVTGIDDAGFIHFKKHVGLYDSVLPASTVTVLGKRPLTGVIATLPPHLLKDSDTEKPIRAEEMVIDLGYPAAEARKLVSVGDYAVLRSSCAELLNGLVLGKSFDNRASCAVLLQLMELLRKVRPRYDCFFVFSAGEEFGGYGAGNAAFAIEPDEAIVLDTTFAVSPFTDESQGKQLGGGPAVGISPILDTHNTEKLIGVARSRSIPYQTEVMSGRTGTNCDEIVVTRDGVPACLVSIPLRYMHSAGEVVSLADLEYAVQLILDYIEYRGGDPR